MDETNQKKKMLLTGIIATVVLFVTILIVLLVLMGQDSKKTKIILGNNQFKTKQIEMTAEDNQVYQYNTIIYQGKEMPMLLTLPAGKTYFCIETVATMAGYKYNKGAYGALDESTDNCHIDNGGEYVTFSSGSDALYKNIKRVDDYDGELKYKKVNSNNASEIEDEELVLLEKPVIKFSDGKLYASYDAITQGLNMKIIADGSNITIFPMEQLIKTYSDFLTKEGYTLTLNFRNQRALYKGYAVVAKNKKYGVLKIEGNNYDEVISAKYDTVEYVQSIEEFIISSDGNYGMIAPGSEQPTIALKYDSIKLLDAGEKLYIVENDKKFGVVNTDGEIIIPTEYDQIGLKDIQAYKSQGITSKYLIAGECIPVMRNGLYGLFSKEGYTLARTNYTSIGCENPSKLINNTSAMPTLVVPLTENVNCIVFSMENSAGINYGMMTTDGTIVRQPYYTAIYYMTSNGKPTYYFNKINNNEVLTLEELINTNSGLKNLINNKNYKKKTKEQLEKDTKAEQEQMENLNENETSEGNQGDGDDEDNDNDNET